MKNTADYSVSSDYTFYILVTMDKSSVEYWASVQGNEELTLKVVGCNS